jgi:hypothetical protein
VSSIHRYVKDIGISAGQDGVAFSHFGFITTIMDGKGAPALLLPNFTRPFIKVIS